MATPMLVALDQGTTSTRAMVFRAHDLVPLYTAQYELTQYYPQEGWVEHDLENIWCDTQKVLRKAGDYISNNDGAALALGISNQRETICLWDRDSGKPLHRAIVWQDRRTAQRCAQLEADGVANLINAKTGLLLNPYFSATKLHWLLEHVAGARVRAQRGEVLAGTIDSFLLWRLTQGKVFATDVTNASRTQLCNIATLNWDDELLQLHDVPRACLPQILDCTADFGTTDLLGAQVPIGGIAGDQQAAALGQACLAPGETKSTYGTGCFVIVQGGDQPLFPGNGLLGTVGYRVAGRTTYAVEGSIFVAGAAVQWLRDKLGLLQNAAESQALAQAARPSDQTYLVPAFAGLGAPYWRADAQGTLVGMTQDTGPAEIVRATLHSIAYATADLTAALARAGAAPTQVNIDGGMAANDYFAQFLTDIIDIPVSRPQCTESTAMGVAFLAGLQIGTYAKLEQIVALRVEQRRFTPSLAVDDRTALLAGWQRALAATLAHADAGAK